MPNAISRRRCSTASDLPGDPLDDEGLARYARHLVLREVGGAGQARLARARVLIVGAGGLGSPLALYLAAAGVGEIGLVDPDHVELSNLQRQILFGTADVGAPKVAAAGETLRRLNPRVTVREYPLAIDEANAADLIAGWDIVADGSDNMAARQAVNRACMRAGAPLVTAAVARFSGQVAAFRGRPCYRCFAEDGEDGTGDCAEQGILGAVAGVTGTLAAVEVLKEVLGLGAGLTGRLLLYDALDARTRIIDLPADPACPVCGRGSAGPPPG